MCESIELLCEAISNCKGIRHRKYQLSVTKLSQRAVVEQLSEDCCNNTCKECPSLDLEGLNDIKEICYYEWIKEKYYKKELIRCSGSDLKEKLTEKSLPLKRHYNKRGQSKKYKEHISNLKGSKFVIHVDYSENCKNKQKTRNQVSILQAKAVHYLHRLYLKNGKSPNCV